MKIFITITTINIPTVIGNLVKQEIREQDELYIVIIGDYKTPLGIKDYINSIKRSEQVHIQYLDTSQQFEVFGGLTSIWNHLPFNSFSRRNLADLHALSLGADVIIRIDDDNFPINPKFIINHLESLGNKRVQVITSKQGWFNICETLIEKNNKYFYPRGFPYKYRHSDIKYESEQKIVNVGLNAGLWLGDPDIDAVTRLAMQPDVLKFDERLYGSSYALNLKTWTPINTQNTAYTREVAKIVFVSPHVGRFDDIFAGYLLRAVLDNNDIYTSYGLPLVEQIRNTHNLWNDESLERFGNTTGEEIIDFCKSYVFATQGLLDNYGELATAIQFEYSKYKEIDQMVEGINCWLDSLSQLKLK